jgi:hypothetical protein
MVFGYAAAAEKLLHFEWSRAEWISFTNDAAPGGYVMFSFARGSEFVEEHTTHKQNRPLRKGSGNPLFLGLCTHVFKRRRILLLLTDISHPQAILNTTHTVNADLLQSHCQDDIFARYHSYLRP